MNCIFNLILFITPQITKVIITSQKDKRMSRQWNFLCFLATHSTNKWNTNRQLKIKNDFLERERKKKTKYQQLLETFNLIFFFIVFYLHCCMRLSLRWSSHKQYFWNEILCIMFIYMRLNGVDLSVIHSSNYYKYIFKVSIFGLFCFFFYFFSFHRINIYLSAWNLRQMEIYVVPHIRCNTIFEVKFIVRVFFFSFYVANKVLISIVSAAVYLFV